jgi:hypothetical protein
MHGISRTYVRVSTPIERVPSAATPTNELMSRRYAGDFSSLAPVVPGNDRSPLPDYDKDLPRIPSTSTGLEDSEVVSVFTSLSGTLTITPVAGCPALTDFSHDAYEPVQLTEAQRIAAQYRQLHRSSSDVLRSTAISEPTIPGVGSNRLESRSVFPSSIGIRSGARVDGQAMDAATGAPLAPHSPPMRQALAEEIEAIHEAVRRLGRVHDDGTVSCTREDCLEFFPSLVAFLSHISVHLIREGYVACLRRAFIWNEVLIKSY